MVSHDTTCFLTGSVLVKKEIAFVQIDMYSSTPSEESEDQTIHKSETAFPLLDVAGHLVLGISVDSCGA